MKGIKRNNKIFFAKLCVLLINKSHWKLGESMHIEVIIIIDEFLVMHTGVVEQNKF